VHLQHERHMQRVFSNYYKTKKYSKSHHFQDVYEFTALKTKLYIWWNNKRYTKHA